MFLWAPAAAALTAAPVFAQNPEPYAPGGTYYRPELIEAALATAGGVAAAGVVLVPPAGVVPRGECCGIVGGTNIGFLRHYAAQGLRLIREPANAAGLGACPDRQDLTITLEQYLLAACIEHHRGRAGSPFRDVAHRLPVPLVGRGRRRSGPPVGFTHLIADTKRDPDVVRRLERRVRTASTRSATRVASPSPNAQSRWSWSRNAAPGASWTRRNSWALRATTIVETLISTAPTAGDSVTPAQARAPAASGMATTL